MYGCESWTVKKAKRRRIDAFELWCWRRLLRVPWTARRSNQSILKAISPGISLEGMMQKLKFQYFGHVMRRVDSLDKTLMLGGIGCRRKRGWQRMRWQMAGWHHLFDWREFECTPGVGDGQGGLACCDSWGHKESDRTERLNWTEGTSLVAHLVKTQSAELLNKKKKDSICNAEDPSWIPGSGRSPGEGIGYPLQYSWDPLVAQRVKNTSAMQETWVQILGWGDPLEDGMATHSSIIAWRIPMDRGAYQATVHGVTKSQTRLRD